MWVIDHQPMAVRHLLVKAQLPGQKSTVRGNKKVRYVQNVVGELFFRMKCKHVFFKYAIYHVPENNRYY